MVSISGAVAHPTVHEVPLGMPLRTILHNAGADDDPQAVLTGGYGGVWLSAEHLDVAYCDEVLHPLGARVGAGVLVVVPRDACGLAETHRVVRWMANESSRQCGPCAFGLPALAEDLAALVAGSPDASVGTDATARTLRGHRRSRGLSPPRRRRATGRVGVEASSRPISSPRARHTVRRGDVEEALGRGARDRTRVRVGVGMTRRGDHFVLKVDPILCDGFGHCHELAPELVRMDEWGYPILRPGSTSMNERANLRIGTTRGARLPPPGPANRARRATLRRDRRGRRFLGVGAKSTKLVRAMGSLIKKRRKRMRKKKHKKMLKRTRFQRRAAGK